LQSRVSFTKRLFEAVFSFPKPFLQASLVVAVLVLLYCLYVVQDWLDMLTHDQVVFVKLLTTARIVRT